MCTADFFFPSIIPFFLTLPPFFLETSKGGRKRKRFLWDVLMLAEFSKPDSPLSWELRSGKMHIWYLNSFYKELPAYIIALLGGLHWSQNLKKHRGKGRFSDIIFFRSLVCSKIKLQQIVMIQLKDSLIWTIKCWDFLGVVRGRRNDSFLMTEILVSFWLLMVVKMIRHNTFSLPTG